MSTWNKSENIDLLVVGAGVAGAVVARTCAARGMKVLVLRRTDESRRMESLSPDACKKLGDILKDVGEPFDELVAWWGNAKRKTRPQAGARVIWRKELAKRLQDNPGKQTSFLEIRQSLHLSQQKNGWALSYIGSDGHAKIATAKYVCDATGRQRSLAHSLGAQCHSADNLCCASIQVEAFVKAGTYTESVSNGWWNLCCNGSAGTLGFYSTPCEVRSIKNNLQSALAKTQNIKDLVMPISANGGVRIYLCSSTILSPCAGENWIAVGDAATTIQPLASAGIIKALRDAELAATTLIGKHLDYDRRQQTEFRIYQQQLSGQYALETRWPDSMFWRQYQRHSRPDTKAATR